MLIRMRNVLMGRRLHFINISAHKKINLFSSLEEEVVSADKHLMKRYKILINEAKPILAVPIICLKKLDHKV